MQYKKKKEEVGIARASRQQLEVLFSLHNNLMSIIVSNLYKKIQRKNTKSVNQGLDLDIQCLELRSNKIYFPFTKYSNYWHRKSVQAEIHWK